MKIVWNKKTFVILFVLTFVLSYVNNMAIILLDLSVFQMIITTTVGIVIGLAILWVLQKHGYLPDKTKNVGDKS